MFCSGYKATSYVFKSSGIWSKAFLKAHIRASREQLRRDSKGEVFPTGHVSLLLPFFQWTLCFATAVLRNSGIPEIIRCDSLIVDSMELLTQSAEIIREIVK